LLSDAHKESIPLAFSIEHLYSSALFHPMHVDVTLYTLQLQKEVDNAVTWGRKFDSEIIANKD